ncbi:hypothetical protein A176_005771 [Myxococcus hansupus]|uniref:Beta-ketoacyl synthase N-terminal domain-containing protein n=1 Tax=Pseudomyxococcus hansupus TaxID=1297742 RepID=A0A0H4X159_9BACT|nr:hypothetical protein A176_005771 [Myxococcus hansupus]
MVSSVGRTALAACAAIHARISRPRKLRYFRSVDEETQDAVGLTAHPLTGYTEGFDGVGRWRRLALGALEDLLRTPCVPKDADSRFWGRTGMVGVLPVPEDLLPVPEPESASLLALCLSPLRDELGLDVAVESMKAVAMGSAGLFVALEMGLRWLDDGVLDRCLIVVADSYLTPLPLLRLSRERRLKWDGQPVGLMPGEAGVGFLLERETHAVRRGASPLARILAVATGRESSPGSGARHFSGVALGSCVRDALGRSAAPLPFSGDIHVDLNGESWRSRQWGGALARLRDGLAEPRIHTVASSVGDTGCASAALGLCQAVHGLCWGHARSNPCLVVSSADDGAVGCVAVQGMGAPIRALFMGRRAG